MDFQQSLPVEVQANACPGDHSRCSNEKSEQAKNRTHCLFPFRPCAGLTLCELFQRLFHAVLLVADVEAHFQALAQTPADVLHHIGSSFVSGKDATRPQTQAA